MVHAIPDVVECPDELVGQGDFVVGDTVTIYQAAMLLTGRYPYDDGPAWMERAEGSAVCRDAWDMLCFLMAEVEVGRLPVVRPGAFKRNRSIDPYRARVRTADLRALVAPLTSSDDAVVNWFKDVFRGAIVAKTKVLAEAQRRFPTLSRRELNRHWDNHAPPEWKKPGRRVQK